MTRRRRRPCPPGAWPGPADAARSPGPASAAPRSFRLPAVDEDVEPRPLKPERRDRAATPRSLAEFSLNRPSRGRRQVQGLGGQVHHLQRRGHAPRPFPAGWRPERAALLLLRGLGQGEGVADAAKASVSRSIASRNRARRASACSWTASTVSRWLPDPGLSAVRRADHGDEGRPQGPLQGGGGAAAGGPARRRASSSEKPLVVNSASSIAPHSSRPIRWVLHHLPAAVEILQLQVVLRAVQQGLGRGQAHQLAADDRTPQRSAGPGSSQRRK